MKPNNSSARILLLIPRRDFDPAQAALPWFLLKKAGFEFSIATHEGQRAQCDQRLLTGKGLGPLGPFMMATKEAREAYEQFIQSPEFRRPLAWTELRAEDYDGVVIPGGHGKGVRELIESTVLQRLVARFFELNKPVGAIAQGVLLVSRAELHGASVLRGRKTTAPRASHEKLMWHLTRLFMGDYALIYPGTTIEGEIKKCLAGPIDFVEGPSPWRHENLDQHEKGFACVYGNYVSARTSSDCTAFAHSFFMRFQRTLSKDVRVTYQSL